MTTYTQETRHEPTPYFRKLQSWLDNTEKRFGSYMPLFHGNALDPSKSDLENYESCMQLYRMVDRGVQEGSRQQPSSSGKENVHLKLVNHGNRISVYDMNNGSLHAMYSMSPNGGLMFYGPKDEVNMFLGREGFKGMQMDALDGKLDGGYFQGGKPQN